MAYRPKAPLQTSGVRLHHDQTRGVVCDLGGLENSVKLHDFPSPTKHTDKFYFGAYVRIVSRSRTHRLGGERGAIHHSIALLRHLYPQGTPAAEITFSKRFTGGEITRVGHGLP
jgi:hypothetical protein